MSVLTDNMALRAGDHLILTWNIYQSGTWYWNEMSVRVEREFARDLRVSLVRYVYDEPKMRITYVVAILVSRPKNLVTLDQVTAMITKGVTSGLYPSTRRGTLNQAEPSPEVKQPAGSLEAYRGYDLQPLDPNVPLKPGDRILIRFAWIASGTYGRAAQWAAVEEYLEKYSEFTVVSYTNREKFLDVEVRVNEATMDAPEDEPRVAEASVISVVTVLAIASVIISAAAWLTLHKAFKLVDKIESSPEGRAIATGISAGGFAVLIGVGLLAGMKLGLIK